MKNTVNQFVYGKRDSYSNYSVVARRDEKIKEISLAQQMGAESLAESTTRPDEQGKRGKFEVIREITLYNSIPKGSRMRQTSRTFKKGEVVLATSYCGSGGGAIQSHIRDSESGHFKVVDGMNGMTYHFGCGRGKALRRVEEGDESISTDNKKVVDVIVQEPSFFQKNKTIIIVAGILILGGAGYYFWKKK